MDALRDEEVQKQIEHMVKFIKKEGQEKADEIDTKAEEEFNIEKVRIVQTEKKAILKVTERKAKQAEVEEKIERSNQLNVARLKLLKAQDEHLTAIFAKTAEQLSVIAADKTKYAKICEDLLVQGLLSLCEKNVEVRCRKGDTAIVKGTFSGAAKAFKAKTTIDAKLTLNETEFLPETCGGGVELRVGDSYRVCNTLEQRLELACQQTLPAIRNILFGVGTGSRAFFD
eukprot:m.9512 g.9512  ORF g.9512 m.9512 type:complete len:228 (+) comp6928_c0_seq1:185-868(+)